MVEQGVEMRILITNTYKSLFTSHARGRINELLPHVQGKVSDDMNRTLM